MRLLWSEFALYLFTVKKLDRSSESTYRGRFTIIKSYFKEREYNKQNCYLFFAHLEKIGYKHATINNYITLLRHLNGCLEIDDFLKDFTKFKIGNEHIETLTIEELQLIKKNAYNLSYHAGVMCEVLLLGLRNNEVCSLRWEDLKEDRFVLRDTKSGEDQYCYIPPELYQKILKLPRHSHGYIFGTKHRNMYHQRMNIKLRKIASLSGITKYVHAHLIRHSVATIAAQSTNNAFKVQKFMRHKNISTTMKYVHLNLNDVKEVTETIMPETMTFDTLKGKVSSFIESLRIYDYPVSISENEEGISIKIALDKN